MNFGKLLSSLARRILIPAVAKIAANPKAPLTLDAAKDALVESGESEVARVVVKRGLGG